MNTENFTHWLQGMLEYEDISKLTEDQLRTKMKGIQDHLKLVFDKVTPKDKSYDEIIKEFDKTIRQQPHKDSTGLPPKDSTGWPHDWFRTNPPVWVDSPLYPTRGNFPKIIC